MQLHLFTSSAAIAAMEMSARWQESFDLSRQMSCEDLELDIVSHCSIISSLVAISYHTSYRCFSRAALLMHELDDEVLVRVASNGPTLSLWHMITTP